MVVLKGTLKMSSAQDVLYVYPKSFVLCNFSRVSGNHTFHTVRYIDIIKHAKIKLWATAYIRSAQTYQLRNNEFVPNSTSGPLLNIPWK